MLQEIGMIIVLNVATVESSLVVIHAPGLTMQVNNAYMLLLGSGYNQFNLEFL